MEKQKDASDSSSGRSSHPSAKAFRKVKWIKRRRGIFVFLIFLSLIGFVLFFDYYWVLITRLVQQPSRVAEKAASKASGMSDAEQRAAFETIKKLLETGRIEEARQTVLGHLQKQSSAEGNYMAGLVYMSQGDVSSAYRYFKEAIRLKHDFFEAKQRLAEIYLTIGDLKSAQETATVLTREANFLEDGLLLQSEIALAEGKLDEALKKLTSSIDKGKASEKASIFLANLYLRKGERIKAERIIDGIDPKRLGATELIALARYYENTGKREAASSVMKGALGRYPDSPEVQYYFGQDAFNHGRYEEAISYFQKVFNAMPNSRIASYRLGQSLVASGHLKEANGHIEAALKRYPHDVLALGLKVRYELLAGRMNIAIENLKQTVNLVPDAPRPQTLLAELYWNEGILSVAESYAQNAIKLGERSVSPRIVLGDIYFRKGQYAKALEQYGRILEREPSHPIALMQSADACFNLGDVKRAETFLEKMVLQYPKIPMIRAKLDLTRSMKGGPTAMLEVTRKVYQDHPENPKAIEAYVRALGLNNRPEDAAAVLKRAIQGNSRNPEYHVMLGDVYLVGRQLEAARASYQEALRVSPKNLNLLINIGSRLEKNSLDKDAELLYQKAVQLAPDNIVVVNHIAWFYTDAKGDYAKAKPYIDTLRVRGEGAYEKDTVGWYFYKTADYGSAETYFRDAIKLDPDNNFIRGHLALTLYQTGKSNDAFVEAERVVSLLPPGNLKERLSYLLSLKKKGTR